jgi:hypothetical protein
LAVSLQTPEAIRTLQRKLYGRAKAEPNFRFYLLYDKVWRADILRHAYDLACANKGAPGVDGVTFAQIEVSGLEDWLARLGEELRTKRYQCQPVRRVMIPKPGGGERPLGIPTIRDRVVQTAAKLVLEPIFEADMDPAAYGYRPRRSGPEAIQAVLVLLRQNYTDVVDAPWAEPDRSKTRLCDARQERFDFLGYSFGQHCFRRTGRWFAGASPSKKSVHRLKDRVAAILAPGNMGPWEEVRDTLNRLLRVWCGYFGPGSRYVTDRAIETHLYDRVRSFLVRRHKLPTHGSRQVRADAVFGTLGVLRLRMCRRTGVMS